MSKNLLGLAASGAAAQRRHAAAVRNGYGYRRRALRLGTALLGCLLTFPAAAASGEGTPAMQVAQAERRWTFDIPAQDLAAALIAYAEATGIQVAFKSEDLAGLSTAGLQGEMTAEEGLRRLLAQTNLTYDFASDSSVVVSPASGAAEADDGSQVLGTITVQDYRNITSDLPTEGYVSYYSTAATKTDTPVIETPQSISTIGRQEMEDRDVQTVAEAVRYSPGITVDAFGVDPRGYDSIMIRGFQAATTGSFRDGLRMDGNFFAVYTTEPYGIERVDIMRGPSGALYGQGEAGGVIDRTTKRPRADMTQELRIGGGDWGRKEGAFDVGGAITEDHDALFRLTGLVRRGDTEFDYLDGTKQQDDRIFIAPAFTWQPNDDTNFTLVADYLHDNRTPQFNTYANERIGRTDVVPGEPNFDKFEQEQFSIGYDFAHRFDDAWEFRQRARYFYVDVDYQAVVMDFLEPDNVTLQRYVWSSPDTLHQVAVDNQLESRFEMGPTFHVMLFGLDYSRSSDEVKYHNGPADPLNLQNPVYSGDAVLPPPYQHTEQVLQQAGVYVQDQITLFDNWIFTLGGRYSYVDQKTEDLLAGGTENKNDDAFTGRVGLTYLFDNGLAPYVSYTEGFVPTQGTDLSGDSFDPEESVQYEAGVKYQPKGFNALFTASVFHLTKTNVLTRDPDNIFNSLQAGEVRSRGIELEAKASLTEGLDVSAAYSYTDAEVTKSNDVDLGQRPVIVPEHTAAAWLNYRFQDGPLEGLGLGGGVRYVGSSYNDSANTSKNPDYALVDARLSYEFLENLSIQVNANNLFDKEYTTTCSFGSCFYGTGRRVLASLSYRW